MVTRDGAHFSNGKLIILINSTLDSIDMFKVAITYVIKKNCEHEKKSLQLEIHFNMIQLIHLIHFNRAVVKEISKRTKNKSVR